MKKLILTALAATVMFAFYAQGQTYNDLNKGSAAAASQAKSGDAAGASVTAKKITQNGSFSTTTTPGLRNAVNNAIEKAKADQNNTSSSSTSTSTSPSSTSTSTSSSSTSKSSSSSSTN